ncbi:hypothetical protein GOBAR_AA09912 [Gossypium barbadense]|uniref:Uncharacterized protein n=1 Tax=Gossypium barbadense TaxID=3634 RepID=A0A2P5Y567_GOSBA|nr:hypothetical protein GOBAR_AA09912 [Gossypium barbadense]
MELRSTFHLQNIMTNYNDPDTVQFRLRRLVRQLNVPEFGSATYNPSHSKASALPPSLRYLHAILAHKITGRREAPEDITDDVPPQHEDPPCQPPPPSRPVHAAALYADISERFTRFEQ